MRLRHILIGIILGVSALTLLFACAGGETAPPPPPPPMVEPPPPPPPVYFVNTSSLALREGPTASAPMITTLSLNDEVELMGTSDGWANVRDLRRNVVGWASMRYLQPAPASRARSAPPRRKAPAAPQKEEAPKPAPAPKAM